MSGCAFRRRLATLAFESTIRTVMEVLVRNQGCGVFQPSLRPSSRSTSAGHSTMKRAPP